MNIATISVRLGKGREPSVETKLCELDDKADAKIDGVITFVDITDRKLMEERLRSLANKVGH